MRRISLIAAAGALAACSHETGGLNERCGPDKACNAGLYCDVDTCIATPLDGGPGDADESIDAPVDGRHPGIDAKLIDALMIPDGQPGCAPRVSPATQAHIHSAGATTHAGEACMTVGCHLSPVSGIGAPSFDFAGTVYGSNGTTPNAGATIQLSDAAGITKTTTTDTAGTFYLLTGTFHATFPVAATATVCPSVRPMVSELQSSGDGNCSRSGCHVAGAQGAIKLDPTN